MFINVKNEKPAWLLSHDENAVYTLQNPSEETRHRHTVPSHDFFTEFREATVEEIAEHSPAKTGSQRIETKVGDEAISKDATTVKK